jgi:hypothetical protein
MNHLLKLLILCLIFKELISAYLRTQRKIRRFHIDCLVEHQLIQTEETTILNNVATRCSLCNTNKTNVYLSHVASVLTEKLYVFQMKQLKFLKKIKVFEEDNILAFCCKKS